MKEVSQVVLIQTYDKYSFVNVSVDNIFSPFPHLVPPQHRMTKEAYLKKLGKHVAHLREQAGLSQSELASRCNKDRQSINRLEKGGMNPTAFYLLEIAQELNLPVSELLDFDSN